jgi:hypothetical protein
MRPGFQPRVADDLDLSNFDRALTTDETWKTSDLLRGDSCPSMEDLVPPPSPLPRPALPPLPSSAAALAARALVHWRRVMSRASAS